MMSLLAVVCSIDGAACSYDYGALSGRGAGGSAVVVGTGGATPATGGTRGQSGGTSGAAGGRGVATGGAEMGGGAGGAAGLTGSAGATRGSGGEMGGQGGKGGMGGNGAGGDPDLVLWYPFDEAMGTQASDRSGFSGGPRDAKLAVAGTEGSAMFTSTHRVGTHAIAFASNAGAEGGFATLPSLFDLAPNAVTFSVWVYPMSSTPWQRVFDFGNDRRTTYMFLTLAEGADANRFVRFAITQGGDGADEILDSHTALSLNEWHHLAVVLTPGSPYTGKLYVDGILSGSNAAMTLHPIDLAVTALNYLGRSQYPVDPYLTGLLDDFRVYKRALGDAEVGTLFTLP